MDHLCSLRRDNSSPFREWHIGDTHCSLRVNSADLIPAGDVRSALNFGQAPPGAIVSKGHKRTLRLYPYLPFNENPRSLADRQIGWRPRSRLRFG